jgi:hypothetical protein
MNELLGELVPAEDWVDDRPGDWDDVLRRARRGRPRRRVVLGAAVVVAALAAAPAIAVHVLATPKPKLPDAADRSNVLAIMQPRTGRILIEAAPWKGHEGVCYLIAGEMSGCARRRAGGTMFSYATNYPFLKHGPRVLAFWGYTFDRRVASARAIFPDGSKRVVPVHRVGGRLDITFLGPVPMPLRRAPQAIALYDAQGKQIG